MSTPFVASPSPSAIVSGGGSAPSVGGGGSGTGTIVGIVVGAFAALFLVALVSAYLILKKKPKSKLCSCFGSFFLSSNNSASVGLQSYETNLFPPLALDVEGTGGESTRISFSQRPEVSKVFTYEELVEATNGFSASNLLGEGGFGRVYEGTTALNLVAVKHRKVGGGQGEREFRAEVKIISRVRHRRLVPPVGYCISDTHRLLVYKFVPNGTLEEALHGPGKQCMDWATRMNIALGTARGLARRLPTRESSTVISRVPTFSSTTSGKLRWLTSVSPS